MSDKTRSRKEIIEEMTQMIAGHLAQMPPDERKSRLDAFEAAIKGGEKRAGNRPRVRRASRTRRSSRRIPA
jgi:hypothetical protein